MFEKEAEERARNLKESQTLGVCYNDEDYARNSGWNCGEVVGYEEGFKDGAEFGYNKCKEELEKENAELKEKISVLLSCKNCSENKGGWICAKEYENKCLAQKITFIKELKNENAEMKEQLTKAKELLAKWVELFKPKSGNIPPTPVQVETEQFLNEARAKEGQND